MICLLFVFELDSGSQLVEVQTLITAQVLHERWHVQRVQHLVIVHIEVLPSPTEILIHVFFSSRLIHLLMLHQDFLGSGLCPLFVHQERARRLTLIVLFLECILYQNMMHKFIWAVFVEFFWELSLVLFAVSHHIRITGEEVASLWHFFNLDVLRTFVILVIVTLAYLHVCLVVLLLFEVFILVVFFGLVKIIALIAGLILTVLIVHHLGLLDELVVFFHLLRLSSNLFLFILFLILLGCGVMLCHIGSSSFLAHFADERFLFLPGRLFLLSLKLSFDVIIELLSAKKLVIPMLDELLGPWSSMQMIMRFDGLCWRGVCNETEQHGNGQRWCFH